MKVSLCPYCGGEYFFSEVIRADSPNLPENGNTEEIIEAVKKHERQYGFWYNRCTSCEAWSIYKNGKNYKMKNKSKKPEKYSYLDEG